MMASCRLWTWSRHEIHIKCVAFLLRRCARRCKQEQDNEKLAGCPADATKHRFYWVPLQFSKCQAIELCHLPMSHVVKWLSWIVMVLINWTEITYYHLRLNYCQWTGALEWLLEQCKWHKIPIQLQQYIHPLITVLPLHQVNRGLTPRSQTLFILLTLLYCPSGMRCFRGRSAGRNTHHAAAAVFWNRIKAERTSRPADWVTDAMSLMIHQPFNLCDHDRLYYWTQRRVAAPLLELKKAWSVRSAGLGERCALCIGRKSNLMFDSDGARQNFSWQLLSGD